jgi:FkbM family methyltransferase
MSTITRSLRQYCGFLEPVRDFPVADALWSRWNPESFDLERRRRHHLRAFFNEHDVRHVFDIGANVGTMTALYVGLGSRVLCVEPDPLSVSGLRHRFRWNSRVDIEAVGVAREADERRLNRYPACRAYDTFSDKQMRLLADDRAPRLGQPVYPQDAVAIKLVTLDQLIAKHGAPDYIKIDVEGFEIEVLKGLSRPIRLVSFECNLPEFEAETLECIAHLHQLHEGYAYNFWPVDHSFHLMSDRWLTPDAISDVIRTGRHRFMEIIAVLHG